MRVSEALMLGSTLLKPKTKLFDDDHGSGCALGMINRALGGTSTNQVPLMSIVWLTDSRVKSPCCCYPREQNVRDTVIHLFDDHFASLTDPWSIDRIAQWLESVDPTPRETPQLREAEVNEIAYA